MQKLWEHSDGKSEVRRQKKQPREALKKLTYWHEHTFRFDKYINALQSNFQVLERFDVPIYEEDKMTYLLNNISVNSAEFKTTISIVRQRFTTFNESST